MTVPLVISAISLCICVFSFFFFRWYIARKTAARELLADYHAEVYRLIAEIDAAADRDSLLVEERIKTLKKLLDDTDRRIGVYMRELQRSKNGEAMYASLGRGIRAALDSRSAQEIITEGGQENAAVTTKSEGPPQLKTPVQETAPPPGPPPSLPPPPNGTRTGERVDEQRWYGVGQEKAAATTKSEGPPARKRGAKKTKLKVQIAELSARGLSPSEIASRLGLSLAEVDLALNLLYRGNES